MQIRRLERVSGGNAAPVADDSGNMDLLDRRCHGE